jgi:hypothetical protein
LKHRLAPGMRMASGSTGRKVLRAVARGWAPDSGPVRPFLRKRRRRLAPLRTGPAIGNGGET